MSAAERKQRNACVGKSDIFFGPDNLLDGGDLSRWEEECELEAKRVCNSCPNLKSCAEKVLEGGYGDIESPGVFGAMNRWERGWLLRNPVKAKSLAKALKAKRVNPVKLREWATAVGPEGIRPHVSPRQTAYEYGFAETVAAQWHADRGLMTTGRWRTPWSQAVRDKVLSDPSSWWDQTEVLESGFHLIPEHMVESTREGIAAVRGACSTRSAKMRIMHRTVAAAVASQIIEKRRCPETGRIQLKAKAA